MFKVHYHRQSDGLLVTAAFHSFEAARQWAIDTGRPGAKIEEF